MEVGQGVAVGVDEDAGAAALPAVHADRDDRRVDLLDRGDALRLGVEHGLVHVDRARPARRRPATSDAAQSDGASRETARSRIMARVARSGCHRDECTSDARFCELRRMIRSRSVGTDSLLHPGVGRG